MSVSLSEKKNIGKADKKIEGFDDVDAKEITNQGVVFSREMSLIINPENQIRKYGINSSISLDANKVRKVLMIVSLFLFIPMAVCDWQICLILSSIGLAMNLFYYLLSQLEYNKPVPTRKIAQLFLLTKSKFTKSLVKQKTHRDQNLIDYERDFLTFNALTCNLDWFMKEGSDPPKLKVGRPGVDRLMGNYTELKFTDIMKMKTIKSDDMVMAKIFLEAIHNLEPEAKKRVHLIFHGKEISYDKLVFRLFPDSHSNILKRRTIALQKYNEQKKKSTEEENRSEAERKAREDEERKRQIDMRNREAEMENKRRRNRRDNLQEEYDNEYILQIESWVQGLTSFHKTVSKAKMVIMILSLLYAICTFAYKTTCSGYCGYTSITIVLIIPIEIIIWKKCEVNLNIEAGRENLDKNITLSSSNTAITSHESRFMKTTSFGKPYAQLQFISRDTQKV